MSPLDPPEGGGGVGKRGSSVRVQDFGPFLFNNTFCNFLSIKRGQMTLFPEFLGRAYPDALSNAAIQTCISSCVFSLRHLQMTPSVCFLGQQAVTQPLVVNRALYWRHALCW